MINPYVKLKLVLRHTKKQASALQTFADVFVDSKKSIIHYRVLIKFNQISVKKTKKKY